MLLRSLHASILGAALLATAGCLPAYDNGVSHPADLSGTMGDGGDDGGGLSGFFIVGRTLAVDSLMFPDGITGYVDGFASFSSMPTSSGSIMIPIPSAACASSHYLVFTGQPVGLPVVLDTVYSPKVAFPCNANIPISVAHVLLDDPSATGVRTTIARELAGHGDIPMADGASGAAFAANWNWVFGSTSYFEADGTFHEYYNGTVMIDNPQCKLFYLDAYPPYKSGQTSTLINFTTAVATTDNFIVICPKAQTADLNLSAMNYLNKDNAAPTAFPNITAPLRTGNIVTFADWGPTL